MAPQIIAVDEIGSREDCRSNGGKAIYSGSRIIGTVHAYDMKGFREKIPERNVRTADVWQDRPLRKSRKWQRRFHIYDENLEKIC